jgi:hypothetical protein
MRFLKESLLTQASAVSIGALLLMGACAPVSEDAKEKMAEPINCNTAAEDVATLESEKASVVKRVEMGARYIVPIAAAVDILRSYNSDTETSEEFFQDKESVLTGDYNAAIDRKIIACEALVRHPGSRSAPGDRALVSLLAPSGAFRVAPRPRRAKKTHHIVTRCPLRRLAESADVLKQETGEAMPCQTFIPPENPRRCSWPGPWSWPRSRRRRRPPTWNRRTRSS